MRPKKIPMRMCTGCGEMKPKKELVRVVKAPQRQDENGQPLPPEISLDLTGEKAGPGRLPVPEPQSACAWPEKPEGWSGPFPARSPGRFTTGWNRRWEG